MKARPGRKLRDPEGDSDIPPWQISVEVKDEYGALLDGKPSEATLDLIAVLDIRAGIVDRGWKPRDRVIEALPPALTPAFAVTGSNEDAMEPAIPRLRVTESAHVPPGEDERVLNRVLGAIRVAEDEGRDGVEAIGRRLCQGRERGVITGPCPLDQLSVHHRVHSARRFSTRSEH